MAIVKKIELENGIVLNYHRIVSLNKITNGETIIEVASYTSKEKREIEENALANNESFNVYINTEYINKEYSEDETISDTYKYLKTLEKYEGATDDN